MSLTLHVPLVRSTPRYEHPFWRARILEKEKLPNYPGCYLFKKEQEIIYVGKAKNLKKRIKSYSLNNKNYRIQELLNEATKIDFIVTNNEKEALLLEYNLIKNYCPKFNVCLTDSRKFPYIVVEKTQKKDEITS